MFEILLMKYMDTSGHWKHYINSGELCPLSSIIIFWLFFTWWNFWDQNNGLKGWKHDFEHFLHTLQYMHMYFMLKYYQFNLSTYWDTKNKNNKSNEIIITWNELFSPFTTAVHFSRLETLLSCFIVHLLSTLLVVQCRIFTIRLLFNRRSLVEGKKEDPSPV